MYTKKKMSARQSHGRATNRSVSSIKYCQERYSCDGEKAEACYECDECGSLQCAQCEVKLHELPRTTFHDRRRLEPPPPEKLCQLPTCSRRNFADVRCDDCAQNFCFDCSQSVHAHGRRKHHKPQRLDSLSLGLAEINLDDPPADGICIKDGSADDVTARNTRNSVNLLSPDSDDNDSLSLPYLTLPPQESCPTGTVVTAADSHGLGELACAAPVVAPTNMTDCGKALRRQTEESSVDSVYKDCTSFLLADQQEILKVANDSEFIEKLGCDSNVLVKVVSIFGNTGDGKSHTLNHTFFGGKEVFPTSPEQTSCTMGIWAAFDPVRNAIIIDTEGLLGVSANQNQRTRLLLKVLAVSDIVIYRSNADRLHNDLFQFLGDASAAYSKHFSQELRAAVRRGNMNLRPSDLGPAVVIFHETRHTDTLRKNMGGDSPEGFLRQRFQELCLSIDAFSSLEYVGTQTAAPPTDFSVLQNAVTKQLMNTNVRSKRKPTVVFSALQVLNKKFSGKIEQLVPSTFPDQYFTCTANCMACGGRCMQTVNHEDDDVPHSAEDQCQYKHSLDNKVYTCRACYDRGRLTVVVPKAAAASDNTIFGLAKYAWSGYVLECPHCGIIYRSRQYWYGNQDPDKAAIRTEVRHVWPGVNPTLQGTHNAARRLLDGIQYVSDNIASMSAKPAAAVSHWVTDQIAPTYWVPNNQITHCRKCETDFDVTIPIHHCRACGEGFCDECSLKRRKVPERGWGNELVRVCDDCYESSKEMVRGSEDAREVTARRVGEVFSSTMGSVASVVSYPIVKTVPDLLLDSTRPTYWVPDDEITECHVCRNPFGVKLTKHHCRACGQGVCGECSAHNRAVPSRGWDHPVRVCSECNRKKGEL